jgi:hypothetical protein
MIGQKMAAAAGRCDGRSFGEPRRGRESTTPSKAEFYMHVPGRAGPRRGRRREGGPSRTPARAGVFHLRVGSGCRAGSSGRVGNGGLEGSCPLDGSVSRLDIKIALQKEQRLQGFSNADIAKSSTPAFLFDATWQKARWTRSAVRARVVSQQAILLTVM